MIYFTLLLQFICFVIWIALYLIVAVIMPFGALSTYYYYKKKRKDLTDKNADEKQGK